MRDESGASGREAVRGGARWREVVRGGAAKVVTMVVTCEQVFVVFA